MESICPICNGISSINAICPNCQNQLIDQGKLEEFYGPYSPYMEIEVNKLSNGYIDLENNYCMHLNNCPVCGYEQVLAVKEILILENKIIFRGYFQNKIILSVIAMF